MDHGQVRKIFGEVGELYVPLVFEFEEQLPQIKYLPGTQAELDAVDLESSDGRRKANQLVWRDQLTKAHIAASSTILRNGRWIRGMLASYAESNLMSFGANFRGLIEAAADSFDALRDIPLNLAGNFQTIKEALEGNIAERVHVSPELERLLDHYIHARKQPGGFQGPDKLKAKSARAYVTALQEAQEGKIVDCYSDLCEITHPASLTVVAFLENQDDGTLQLSPNPDQRFIDLLLTEYKEVMPRALRLSLNPAFMTLRVINQFPLPNLEVPQVNTLSFDQSEEWRQVKEQMGIP